MAKRVKRGYVLGIQIDKTMSHINEMNKKQSDDSKNREYVMKKMLGYLKDGLSEEMVLDKIMEDPISKEFEYLSKNGLDKRNCFRNWMNSVMKRKNMLKDLAR